MGLFKQVKKPVIKPAASGGPAANARRPAYVGKAAPCSSNCPSGTDVRGWLVALAQHQAFQRTPAQAIEFAWLRILEQNPFPAVCGRVCPHPCELRCNRKEKDGPLAINRLEQFVGDFAVAQGLRLQLPDLSHSAGKVAIVGAGPAGLSAAYHLARMNYAVTVIDAAPKAGGMMRYRIPRSVVPAETLDAEIANILQLGVELRTDCTVGRDLSMAQLQSGYRAVIFAVGLQKAAQLEVLAGADGAAVTVGALPEEPPDVLREEPSEVDRRVLSTVSVAIAQGKTVAQSLAAFLENRALPSAERPPVIHAERVKLDWYPAAPRFDVQAPSMTEAEAIAEAGRCMSCGTCMDCETCWMYCSGNCFVKLPKGEHYKINLDFCSGCGKCADSCPCGYIEMN